jgi:hypothetical protein
MKASRAPVAGESRVCPHCKATILKSSVSCPLCHHLLRFVAAGVEPRAQPIQCPLLVEGTINHPGDGEPLEYSIMMEVHDEGGKLLSRQTVGVGALNPHQRRTFSLRVEMVSAQASA